MRVLVIEDNRDAADVLARLLRMRGKEVEVAYDGIQGLDSAIASRPDVVVTDISMPGLDGYQVAGKIREQPYETPLLIALTAFSRDTSNPLADAFDHFLQKPADFTRLNALIDAGRQNRG
jgi:CheY-like chemotaxis protein